MNKKHELVNDPECRKPLFEPHKAVWFVSSDANDNKEMAGVVQRLLTAMDADAEAGPMYAVLLADGAVVHAFEDELRSVQLKELYELWDQLSVIPTESEGDAVERIDSPFLFFPAGEPREKIWKWFEEQHPEFLTGEVMHGIRRKEAASETPAPAL